MDKKRRQKKSRSSSGNDVRTVVPLTTTSTVPSSHHDEETPLLVPKNNGPHPTKQQQLKEARNPSFSRKHHTSSVQEKTITWAAIVASILTMLLCVLVLVGFVFNIQGWTTPATGSQQGPFGGSSSSGFGGKDDWPHGGGSGPAQLYDEYGRFVLENYDVEPPFSDFLPALAGFYGKPLYAFYLNRGQGIASFGIQSKDFPMMEFNSANKAYQNTALLGFRTFLQGSRKGSQSSFLMEPFSPLTSRFTEDPRLPERRMYVGSNEMQIQELDHVNGIETNVTFFILPEEDFGAFVKRTTIRNMRRTEELTVAMLDGLAKMEPAGGPLDMWLKNIGRTLEGWMGVYSPYNDTLKMPFYRLSSRPQDFAYVEAQEAGHWCLSVIENNDDSLNLLPIIYDPSKVFGEDTTFLRPIMLQSQKIGDILKNPQYGAAKTASAFAAMDTIVLKGGEKISVSTYYGKAHNILDVPVIARRLLQTGFAQYKMSRSREIIEQITSFVKTTTKSPMLDRHISTMFLDNSLRGGIPYILGDVDDDAKMRNYNEDRRLKVFHLFSRIHGDLERDYNHFNIEPTFFSEGPGEFRDVIQNRRNDVTFNPRVGSFNIDIFLSLIQADGYNPLTVEAVAFTIKDYEVCRSIATRAVGEADGHRAQREALTGILNGGPFRPGQLFQLMEEQHIELIISRQDFVDSVAAAADFNPLAVYNTGFWSDHWTYILDLVNNFLEIYPDWEERILFEYELPYFFSPVFVQPRSSKYVLSTTYDGRGKHVRQLNATVESPEKKAYQRRFIQIQTGRYDLEASWQHDASGAVFKSSAMAKLLVLGVLKFATRDPFGIGVEFEGGRPGWDDANNGLPGMIGSGISEMIELAALLQYLKTACFKYRKTIILPAEVAELIEAIQRALYDLSAERGNWSLLSSNDVTVPQFLFGYWDAVATARERYRMKTRVVFSGQTAWFDWDKTAGMIDRWLEEIRMGILIAERLGSRGDGDDGKSGVPPTYFSYNVLEWEETGERTGDGLPLVSASQMEVLRFPLFLEGPTRMMKLLTGQKAIALYDKVKASSLRDMGLNMYTVSASLKGQPVDIGRELAFAPGWLENQSVWLHMSYKYYLELLRHDMFDIFYGEMKGGGILPFMDPQSYGRSLMECSSFIASSAFEDPAMRGRGFLARFSGATAEFLSMWVLMMLGPNTFYVNSTTGDLNMQLLPALPRWLFDDTNYPGEAVVFFKLFGAIDVRYFHRRGNEDLFRIPATRYVIEFRDGQEMKVDGPVIPPPLSDKIRRIVFVSTIDVYFE